MDLGALKPQIMAMFMMKSTQKRDGTGVEDIYAILYTMVMMNVLEAVFRGAPAVFTKLQDLLWKYITRKSNQVSFGPLLTKEKKEESASITLIRKYAKKEQNPYIEKVDAVIDFLCNMNTSKHIQLDQRYTLNTADEVQVTQQIAAKVLQVDYDEEGDLDFIKLKVSSGSLQINELRDWIDEIHRNWVFEKNNKLGNKKFFFNEVPIEPQKQLQREDKFGPAEYNWATAPAALTFTMNEFHTFKSFRNVFGEHVGELRERLDLFVNRPDWYEERGIPHSLGILLHGIPGAGKTSTIKAIAKDTGRHIFNLSLRTYTTQKQLMHLFYNEAVTVRAAGTTSQTYNIPLNKRIYVIEDIDCLTNVVYDRTSQDAAAIAGSASSEAVNLGFLLNLLDGVLETPGRILIITTNYPDKLDKALIRPGRIDVKIHFTWAPLTMIRDMIGNFYGDVGDVEIPDLLDNALSPAEVLESLCTHFKDVTAAVQHMVKRVQDREEKAEALVQGFCCGQGEKEPSIRIEEVAGELPDAPMDEPDYMKHSLIVSTPSTGSQCSTTSMDSAPSMKKSKSPHWLDDLTTVTTGAAGATTATTYHALKYVEYNSGTDISYIPLEAAEEAAREYVNRQQDLARG